MHQHLGIAHEVQSLFPEYFQLNDLADELGANPYVSGSSGMMYVYDVVSITVKRIYRWALTQFHKFQYLCACCGGLE